MKIFRGAAVPDQAADTNTFSGAARVKRLAEDDVAIPVGVYRVAFDEGARTNWHTHSGPQWLFVIEGRVRVQRWGGAAEELDAGDAVVFAPGEKHWHGAAPGGRGTHLAVNVNVKTDWLEPVGEEEYKA